MTRLFLADVHANLPAFEAVLEDAGPVGEVLFLGDIVGWGPHPSECLELLRSLPVRAVAGNHDLSVVHRQPPRKPLARPVDWDEWTWLQLTGEQRDYLSSLPSEMVVESCGQKVRLIHQSDADFYLHPTMPDSLLEAYFRNVPGEAVYCGHSHRMIDRKVGGRRLVCLPPVGQPRNRDPRAGYAVERKGELQFCFVEYDVEATIDGLRRIGLQEDFLLRCERFLRTGFDPKWSREYP